MKEPSIEERVLHELIDDPNIDLSCYTNGDLIEPEQAVSEIVALIQSERRKAAIEAKITELENIHGWWTHGDNDLEPKNLLHRIKDLKATLQDKKESD